MQASQQAQAHNASTIGNANVSIRPINVQQAHAVDQAMAHMDSTMVRYYKVQRTTASQNFHSNEKKRTAHLQLNSLAPPKAKQGERSITNYDVKVSKAKHFDSVQGQSEALSKQNQSMYQIIDKAERNTDDPVRINPNAIKIQSIVSTIGSQQHRNPDSAHITPGPKHDTPPNQKAQEQKCGADTAGIAEPEPAVHDQEQNEFLEQSGGNNIVSANQFLSYLGNIKNKYSSKLANTNPTN